MASEVFGLKRRSSLEVLAEALTICRSPTLKTDVMFGVKTTVTILNRTLGVAERFGLINRSEEKYHITKKGLEFLQTWHALLSFLEG